MFERQKQFFGASVQSLLGLLAQLPVAACLCLAMVPACAQGTQHTGPAAGTGIAPHAAGPGGRISGARPAGPGRGPGTLGGSRPRPQDAFPNSSAAFGQNGPGFSVANPPGFGQQQYIAPPRPSFELPRDPRPTFEVPAHSGVQPYLSNSPSGAVYGFPGYFAPGYLPPYIDSGYGDSGYVDANGQGYGPYGQGPYQEGNGDPNSGNGGPGGYPGGPYPGAINGPGAGARRAPYPIQGNQRPEEQSSGAGAMQHGPNQTVTDGLDHPEITLIYNNGKPPEQVRNYAMTSTTLFILDGAKRRQIPLSELDIAKTVEKNQQEGIDFTVPSSPSGGQRR